MTDTTKQKDISYSSHHDWLAELVMLLSRRSDLGIGADAAAMSFDELRGLYCFLARAEKRARNNASLARTSQ